MSSNSGTNWRAAPAFDLVYPCLRDCMATIDAEFSRRQRSQFVILRLRLRQGWAVMPYAQYRVLPPDHPATPSSLMFFGTFSELRDLCLAFPPDLFFCPAASAPDCSAGDAPPPPDVPPDPAPPDHPFVQLSDVPVIPEAPLE